MKKYRIVEVREPLNAGYIDEKSELPEFIRYGKPFYNVEVRTKNILGIYCQWQFLEARFETAKAAQFYIYNLSLERKERVITTL